MNYTYDPNADYQALIDQAINQGNYYMAAIYEQQRNAKIAGENITGATATNLYSNYLPDAPTKEGYVNPYQQQLEATIGKVTGDFAYNPDKDPIASAYKKTYLREADRTMKDTLGEYSTMTGGIPSTQAVAAASQTADNYKAQLAAHLAELGQQAYDREVGKVGILTSAAQNADNQHYNAISAAMSRWAQLGAADASVAQALGVPIGALTSDAQYQHWQKMLSEREYALQLLSSGLMPNDAQLGAAGISKEQAQQIVAAATSGGGGGYYSTNGGKKADIGTLQELGELWQSGDHQTYMQKLGLMAYDGYDTATIDALIRSLYQYTPPTGYGGIGGQAGGDTSGTGGSGGNKITTSHVMLK